MPKVVDLCEVSLSWYTGWFSKTRSISSPLTQSLNTCSLSMINCSLPTHWTPWMMVGAVCTVCIVCLIWCSVLPCIGLIQFILPCSYNRSVALLLTSSSISPMYCVIEWFVCNATKLYTLHYPCTSIWDINCFALVRVEVINVYRHASV